MEFYVIQSHSIFVSQWKCIAQFNLLPKNLALKLLAIMKVSFSGTARSIKTYRQLLTRSVLHKLSPNMFLVILVICVVISSSPIYQTLAQVTTAQAEIFKAAPGDNPITELGKLVLSQVGSLVTVGPRPTSTLGVL